MEALKGLNPVRFKYKTDANAEEHLGFIAEDGPDVVYIRGRKALRSMELTAVLTKVIQEQERRFQEQQKEIEILKSTMKQLLEK